MFDINAIAVDFARKAYPFLAKSDNALEEFLKDEVGFTYPIDFTIPEEDRPKVSYQEFREYRDTFALAKSQIRKLYNPIDDAKIGDGVTEHGYSDASAGTIISRTAKSITMQYDDATLLNSDELTFHVGGFSAHCSNQGIQKYSYAVNTENSTVKFTRRKDGSWRNCGAQHVSNRYNDVSIGKNKFYDYNF